MIGILFAVSVHSQKVYKHESVVGTYTILDQDLLLVDGTNHDLYISIQPHTFLGRIRANITWNNGSMSMWEFNEGDILKLEDAGPVVLWYTSIGGITITLWNLEKGTCGNDVIFSMNQREATILINKTIESSHICWFLSFVRSTSIDANYISGPNGSQLIIINNEKNKAIEPNGTYTDTADRNLIAVYKNDNPGIVNFSFHSKADISYADWTDKARVFKVLRGSGVENLTNRTDFYIITNRTVLPWIWSTFGVVAGALFGFTLIIFFIRPVQKITKSVSLSDVVKDVQSTKID